MPLDANIWIHLILFWEWNAWWLWWNLDIFVFREVTHLMAEDDSYPPGTWISKNISSTFFGKQIRLRKNNNDNFVTRWFNPPFTYVFGQLWVHHPSIFRAKTNPTKESKHQWCIGSVKSDSDTILIHITNILNPPANCLFPSRDLQIPKFAFPVKNSIKIQAAHPTILRNSRPFCGILMASIIP